MSGKVPGGRGKRYDREYLSTDSKFEGGKEKINGRGPTPVPGRGRGGFNHRSPSHGRADRNHNTKDPRGPPRGRDRYRDDGVGIKRRDLERGATSLPKHGKIELPPQHAQKVPDGKAFTDDSRLSKLVRRVTREDERERRLASTRSLIDFILLPENAKTISKMADHLLVALQEVFYERTFKEVKQEVAKCVGAVGTVLGTDAQRYLQWLFAKLSAAHTDEAKILLLSALQWTLVQDDPKYKLKDFMTLIMSNIQGVLENADLPELLIAVIDIILVIIKTTPHVFRTHFRDTVDILVGWHIDSTQKESLTQFTSDALISFNQFWVSDLNFSVTLLGQFLEDMEAYAEMRCRQVLKEHDLALGVSGQAPADDDIPLPEECVTKLVALLRVFTTVIKSLGDHFTPGRGSITWEYIVETQNRIMICVDSAMRTKYTEKILSAANNCLILLITNLGTHASQGCDELLPFICRQTQSIRFLSNTHVFSLLALIHKVVEAINTKLPETFMSQLFAHGSLMLRHRFAHNKEVLVQLMSAYHTILSLKSVTLLEEAYRHVLGDLELGYNTLLELTESDHQCNLVTNNPYTDVVYSAKQAETVVIFNICALAEIGNTKNNLIGMWALSPTIFDLLTQHLLLVHSTVAEQYPAVHYALLQTLHSHCSRHGNFITSSGLITVNTSLEGTVLANVSPATANHFTTALTLLGGLLASSRTSVDSKCLALKWTNEIVDALQNHQHMYACPEFLKLLDNVISQGFDTHTKVGLGACHCLQTLLKLTSDLPSQILHRCVDLCSVRLSDNDQRMRQACVDLLKLLPFDISAGRRRNAVADRSLRQSQLDSAGADFQTLWMAQKNHFSKVPSGTFHSHNFRSIMACLVYDQYPSKLSGIQWLERIFHSSQRQDKDDLKQDDQITLSSVVDHSGASLWFWATWEAAQFCVLAKLRTPLGKPHDTFTTIENAIKKYAAEVKNRELDDVKQQPTTENNKDSGDLGCSVQMRVTLLLQFMEHLEKLLYNAYEGCAVAIASPPKAVRTFFRTNRATCHDWLMRIRLNLILVALNSHQHSLAVRHAFELLRDMKESSHTQLAEFGHVVMYTVQALQELRCPEAILGLYAWCRDTIGHRMTWIKASADMALGKFEIAAVEFRNALKSYTSPDHTVEDAKEKELFSPSSSPLGSPKHTSGIDGFQKWSILSKQNPIVLENQPDPNIANYLVEQVCDSYLQLNDWRQALDWQETVQQYRSEHSGSNLQKAFYTQVDANFLKALGKFDEHDFEAVKDYLELVPGASLDEIDKDDNTASGWVVKDTVIAARKQFVRAVVLAHTGELKAEMERVEWCLDQSQHLCEGILRVGAQEWPPFLNLQTMMLLHCTTSFAKQLGCKKTKNGILPVSGALKLDPQNNDLHGSLDALDLLKMEAFTQTALELNKNTDLGSQLSQLQLAVAVLARKTHNFSLAEKLLIEEMGLSVSGQQENGRVTPADSLLSALFSARASNGAVDQPKLLRLEREVAKLLHVKGQHREAVETLCTSVVNNANLTLTPVGNKKDLSNICGDLNARSLVSLVSWLQADHKQLSALAAQLKLAGQGDEAGTTHLTRNFKILVDLEQSTTANRMDDTSNNEALSITDNPVLSDSDMLVGQILHLATLQCPNLAKAWFSLAGWCYKWGRKAVDNASHGSVELSADEKAQVLELLPAGTSSAEIDTVLGILSQIHAGVTSEEDISDQDQSLYDDGTETTRKQLLAGCLSLQITSDERVDRLLDVWRGVVRRVYQYYQLSAKAYFTYLKLNAQIDSNQTNMDGNITATLRLLRLLVKHAWELRGVLETGLAHTPTAPWKGIIPQLFSRLNHPESYVRQSVSELLCRVAQDAPHLIVYPAVVGCSSNRAEVKEANRDGLLNEYLSQNEDERVAQGLEGETDDQPSPGDDDSPLDEDPNTAMLQNCFMSIVDTLAHHNPRMISEVQLLVSELRRITLLWDELWLGTLNQHHQDVSRRLTQLDNEVKKVMNNASLTKEEKVAIIREKHNTVLKPTLYTMERLYDITSQTAETTHEQWFQETYGKTIEEALQRLRQPNNPSNPNSSWNLFKQFHRSLQERAGKRSSLLLHMDEISGKLASQRGTVIAMPGINSQGQVVTIEGVYNTVQILPTKTKPKKLIFIGSDGKKYPYLFKGLEDLHLDERIMQFLAIVNNMFAKANKGGRHLYHARHYSVTPLGARSGLIQWVDGATPLFSLYKRWQQREALAQQLKQQQQSGTGTSGNPPTIPRPSEVFYGKLTPALKEKGITSMDNRKEWPMSILRHVLQELMSETPKDLLARELWCSSTSAREWWQVTQSYARSTAVMSMIGYIIGLGDRHLDNVLVDLATGEVVHIDYNVCFEKGKGLRVPERVPFRMTQNIECALGVTGVEGTFRISCEHVIKTMRKGRETLLTLLEAFVYDPLVDWTTGNEGGYTGAFYGGGQRSISSSHSHQSRKEMEREIALSMFSIRVAEMKAAWLKNRDDMLEALPRLLETVQDHLKAQKELDNKHSQMNKLTEQQTYLQEAMEDPKHAAFTLSDRYSAYAVVRSTRLEVTSAIQDKLNECDHWGTLHKFAFQAVQGVKLQSMCADVRKPLNASAASFTPVVEFLTGAGQGQLVGQCEQVDQELGAVLHQRRAVLHSCLDVLHTYATIVGQFPERYLMDNRSTRWQHWLQELISSFSHDKCKDIVSEFQDLYGLTTVPHPNTQTVHATENKLQDCISDVNGKLVKLVERRHLEGSETSYLVLNCQETVVSVHQFMKENGDPGIACMTSVVVTALCSLSKRYLIMEGAAAAAGDRLMDLTSRDGDWFLDELCSISGNVNHLLGLLIDPTVPQLLSMERSQQVQLVMSTTQAVYKALQDLNVNFRNIIMPEAQKTIQMEQASVIAALDSLDEVVSAAERPLDTLLSQLELHIRNAILGIEQSDHSALTQVKRMKTMFDDLLQGSPSKPGDLTPGQMLLMGFNGLFTRLDADFCSMIEAIVNINVPDVWRKVDVVKEARSLQMTSFSEHTQTLLGYLFFVKQLRAMRDFFVLCRQSATALTGTQAGIIHHEEQLTRPIKHFIAEYVRKHMMGLPSQTLGYMLCLLIDALQVDVTAEIELKDIGAESKVSVEDLCKKAVDLSLKNNSFEPIHLTQASTLIGSTDTAWRKCDLAKRLDNNISLLQGSYQRTQLQLSRFQWLNEDIFTKSGRQLNQMAPPVRASVMSDLRKGVQTLIQQETSVLAIQERHLALESSITQRLKWAAGANPSLNPILHQFEETLAEKTQLIQVESSLSNEVVAICNAVLHFEAMRTRTPEAITADTGFLALMNRCEESCVLIESCNTTVSEVEEALMDSSQTLKLEIPVNAAWIKALLDHLGTQATSIGASIATFGTNTDEAKETVKLQVNTIRNILATHHKLMSDIRSILKSLAKQEEQDHDTEFLSVGIRGYVNTYKAFSENFTAMLRLVMNETLTESVTAEVKTMIADLTKQVSAIYDDLVSFAPPLCTKTDEADPNPTPSFATALKKSVDFPPMSPKLPTILLKTEVQTTQPGQASSPGLPLPKLGPPTPRKVERVTRDPRTGKAVQERNSYAVGVWRRVKLKLDGRDPDMNKRLSVAEQVDHIIKEATHLDNLAVLYEGWTPWV